MLRQVCEQGDALCAAGMERGEGCWLHCLGLAGELLQRVPNKAVRLPTANSALLGLPDLARRLILPAVEQGCAPIRCALYTQTLRFFYTHIQSQATPRCSCLCFRPLYTV